MELRRFSTKKGSVLGILRHGKSVYFTLEPEDNLLPEGSYNVIKYDSPKNGRCLLLYNDEIPATRGFEIHVGNSLQNTKGCILLGNSCDLVKRTVGGSRKALKQLLEDHDKILGIGY